MTEQVNKDIQTSFEEALDKAIAEQEAMIAQEEALLETAESAPEAPKKQPGEVSEAKHKAIGAAIEAMQKLGYGRNTIRRKIKQQFGISLITTSRNKPHKANKPPKEAKSDKKKRIKSQHQQIEALKQAKR